MFGWLSAAAYRMFLREKYKKPSFLPNNTAFQVTISFVDGFSAIGNIKPGCRAQTVKILVKYVPILN